MKATDLGINSIQSYPLLTTLFYSGADTVRFKAEINFDGREVTRIHLSRLDLEKLLKVSMLVRVQEIWAGHEVVNMCRVFAKVGVVHCVKV